MNFRFDANIFNDDMKISRNIRDSLQYSFAYIVMEVVVLDALAFYFIIVIVGQTHFRDDY